MRRRRTSIMFWVKSRWLVFVIVILVWVMSS